MKPDTHAVESALARFPRLGLARLPTPLEPLPRLSAHLSGPRLWIKRDDATDLGFGGNKLRKLDYVLHRAVAERCDCLVSGGVPQSNSQRQVAAAATKLGLECHLVVYRGRTQGSGSIETSGNALLNRVFGATSHSAPWTGDRNGAIHALASELVEAGRRPFVVPYGVSSGFGALAYTTAALEIARQAREQGFEPAAVVHASGSGGTQAGLVVGASACLPLTKVIGVDVDGEPERVKADVTRYAAEAAEMLGWDLDAPPIEVAAGYSGPGYGVVDEATIEAIQLVGRLEAVILDPVYTGKAFAGLMAMVRNGRWKPEEDVVFLHTGGAPALFAYSENLTLFMG